MLIGPAKRLLIGERLGPLRDAWQMPQGGIDPGESPLEAACRELLEEIGTDRVELLAESRNWYAYDLPPRADPGPLGAAAIAVRARSGSHSVSPAPTRTSICTPIMPSSPAGVGRPRDEVLRLIVPFKRPVYQAVLAEFADLLR